MIADDKRNSCTQIVGQLGRLGFLLVVFLSLLCSSLVFSSLQFSRLALNKRFVC